MAAIRPVDAISRKWASVTPARVAEYEDGVKNPRADWARETVASEPSYVAGVQASIQQKTFARGVTKAGTARWQLGASTKGVQRFGPGVQVAQGDYEKGFAPYREAISRVQLPPRFARRDPRNLARVAAITDALGKVKAQSGN